MQLVAGLPSYLEGDTFATTAFNTYGAFWWWFALVEPFGLTDMTRPSPAAIGGELWIVFPVLMITYYLIGFRDWLGVDFVVEVSRFRTSPSLSNSSRLTSFAFDLDTFALIFVFIPKPVNGRDPTGRR